MMQDKLKTYQNYINKELIKVIKWYGHNKYKENEKLLKANFKPNKDIKSFTNKKLKTSIKTKIKTNRKLKEWSAKETIN